MKTIKSYTLGIWFFKDFQGAEGLGSNHFQEGVRVLSKNDTFCYFIWDAKFSHLFFVQNLEVALKFKNIWQEIQLIRLT